MVGGLFWRLQGAISSALGLLYRLDVYAKSAKKDSTDAEKQEVIPLRGDAPHVAGEIGHDYATISSVCSTVRSSCQLMMIETSRGACPSLDFENIRHNHLETLDQVIARRCLGRDPALSAGCNPYVRIVVVECVEG